MLETSAMVMMALILGTIWGGLAYFVNRAYRREKREAQGGSDE